MSVSLSPNWPAELDAGEPLERFLLASPASAAVRRELLVYREDESRRTLRIVEVISSDSGAQPSREIERFLDLTQDVVLLLYTIASQPRVEWNVEVVYGRGKLPIVYSLRGRDDVFRLQRLFTGYKPVKYFENVACSVTFNNRRIPMLGRNPQHKGFGEIQLWWPEMEPGNPISPASPTSSRSSQHGISIQPTNPEPVRPMSVVSVQTDFNRGKYLLVSVCPSPPLLVAFLQDDRGYTILKTRVTDLKCGASEDGRIDLWGERTGNFIVDRLSVKKCELDSWNICAIGTKASGMDSLKCTHLSLEFENPMKRREFEKNLRRLQPRRRTPDPGRQAFISALSSGRLFLPSTSTVIDRAPDLASASTNAQPSRTDSLPSLPDPELEPLGTGLFQGLEIDGSPIMGPFELNNRDNGDERRDRTYRGSI